MTSEAKMHGIIMSTEQPPLQIRGHNKSIRLNLYIGWKEIK